MWKSGKLLLGYVVDEKEESNNDPTNIESHKLCFEVEFWLQQLWSYLHNMQKGFHPAGKA